MDGVILSRFASVMYLQIRTGLVSCKTLQVIHAFNGRQNRDYPPVAPLLPSSNRHIDFVRQNPHSGPAPLCRITLT